MNCETYVSAYIFRKRWKKRRRQKRRRQNPSLTPSTSLFYISAELHSPKKREAISSLPLLLLLTVRNVRVFLLITFSFGLFYSNLDVDYLYMAYADIMAKVSGFLSSFNLIFLSTIHIFTVVLSQFDELLQCLN